MPRTSFNADYQKGYNAGKRAARTSRYDQFYAAAMTGLLAGPRPWATENKTDRTPYDYARTAHAIATAMMEQSP